MLARVVLSILLAANLAAAGTRKPTKDQAVKTAEQWLESIADAAPVTGLPLLSFAEATETCAEATTKTAAELPKRLECLAKVVTGSEVVPWSTKLAKKMLGLRTFKKKIARLEKSATIVMHHEQCVGEGSELVMAVALDKETPKVVAVLYQSVFCGE